jgi:RNA polymerase sigma factor for flagellar operon FliA
VALEDKLQRVPTEEEVAEKLGVEVEEFRETLIAISNSSMLALDDPRAFPSPQAGELTLLDALADSGAVNPEQRIDADELQERLVAAVAGLPDRERVVIGLYYYESLNLREIGRAHV